MGVGTRWKVIGKGFREGSGAERKGGVRGGRGGRSSRVWLARDPARTPGPRQWRGVAWQGAARWACHAKPADPPLPAGQRVDPFEGRRGRAGST